MLSTRGWGRQARAAGSSAGRWLALTAIAIGTTLAASAGTIDVKWDPVSASDLAGYKVYYGTTPGSHSNVKDVGKTTSTQLTGLSDCALWYVSVRAYDTGGLESSTDSNSVKGYPRPVVTTVSPVSIKPGETLSFTVTGTNYDAGVNGDASRPRATVTLSNPNLTVNSYKVDACGTITMSVKAANSAANGFSDVTVKNPDLSTTNPAGKPWVFGTKASAIEIKAATDTTAPTVNSTSPAAGATGVVASIRPTVTFSESMLSASITTTTVRLIDVAAGTAVAQSGPPSLAGAVATITPAAALGAGKQYRIEVTGGASGAKDLAGNPLAQNFTQSPAFTIATDGGSPGPLDVTSFNPAAGQTGVPITTTQARITFNQDVSPLWTALTLSDLQRRFRVLTGETFLPHAPSSPTYENGGRTVVITFTKPLTASQKYTTQANLSGAALKRALEAAGHSELYAGRIWRTIPGWTVEAPIETTTFRSPTSGDSGTLETGSTASPDASGGVPVDSEFRIKFQTTLLSTSVNLGTVKLYRLSGSSQKSVPFVGYPTIENGDTIYVKPAGPLEPGKKYRLWVKSGAQGVLMTTSNGNASSKGKGQSINFSTEVTATIQSETLSIGAEPAQTSQQQGGQE